MLSRLIPKTITGQLITVIVTSMMIIHIGEQVEDIIEDYEEERTVDDFIIDHHARIIPMMNSLNPSDYESFFNMVDYGFLHFAHSDQPLAEDNLSTDFLDAEKNIADRLRLAEDDVIIGRTFELPSAFAVDYRDPYDHSEIRKTVISIKLTDGSWINTALNVHNHNDWLSWYWLFDYSFTVSIIVVVVIIFVVLRIAQPLDRLTASIGNFSESFNVSLVKEEGPSDLRQATRSFNKMQQDVANHITKRTKTLAAMSHDIRTPLTALRLKAEILDEGPEKESLLVSIAKMEQITASAIDYLKGNIANLTKKPVDLKILLEAECAEYSEMGKDVVIENCAEIVANCDPEAISRAVTNLLDNAVKYGNSARVSLTKNEGLVVITVDDKGDGISEQDLTKAIEPFERLGKERHSETGGFGLGLSIANDIAALHGGKLKLSNLPGGGLRARLTLLLT